ncbi:unnamed protein product [Camellia sinensis]
MSNSSRMISIEILITMERSEIEKWAAAYGLAFGLIGSPYSRYSIRLKPEPVRGFRVFGSESVNPNQSSRRSRSDQWSRCRIGVLLIEQLISLLGDDPIPSCPRRNRWRQ